MTNEFFTRFYRRYAVQFPDRLEQWFQISNGEPITISFGFYGYARGKCGWGVKIFFAGSSNGWEASCSWERCCSAFYSCSAESSEIFSSPQTDSIDDPNHFIEFQICPISKLVRNEFPAKCQFVQPDWLGEKLCPLWQSLNLLSKMNNNWINCKP